MKRNRIIKVLVILGLLLTFITAIRHSQNMRNKRINQKIGGLIYHIKNNYPDIKKDDILRLLKSEEKSISLKEYGYDETDPVIDFSNENKNDLIILFAFLCLTLTMLYALYIMDKKQRKAEIQGLMDDIDRISKGDYDIKTINEEGHFAQLQNSLYKIATVLKQEAVNSQAKKEVFKNNLEDISHQIKTPLASINLLLDNLADQNLDPELKSELIIDIKNETDSITNLVLMLLKISSLEAKARPFFRKEIKLKEVLDNAISVLKPSIEKNKLKIDLKVADESFIGDINWEKEVYINLLKNAIEHGEDKLITVEARDTNTYLEVAVINKGGNFTREDKLRIFDRFYKVSKSDNNFGIGLNLCKLIVEEDNGKISLENKDSYTKFIIKYFKTETL